MIKRHKKKIILCAIVLIIIMIYYVFKLFTAPTGKTEHIELNNMPRLSICVDKWYCSKYEVTIGKTEGIDKFQDYINSLDLIEVEKDYGRSHSGHSYWIYTLGLDISICGEYLSIHPEGADDKVYTEYYIVDSGYNPITRGSKVSNFIDDLIEMYVE